MSVEGEFCGGAMQVKRQGAALGLAMLLLIYSAGSAIA